MLTEERRTSPSPSVDPNQESNIQKAPDLPLLLRSAGRYWWVCLATGIAMAFAGYAVSNLIPANYRATALIRLGGPQGIVDQPHESSNAQREFRHTQKEMLQMPHVIRRALESPQVAEVEGIEAGPEAVEEIGELVVVELPRSSEIMRVSVSHDNAETAYVLVNAVIKSYLDESQRAAMDERERRVKTLSRLHNESEQRLNHAWNELQALAQQVGSGDPAALSLQTQAEIENYRAYSRRLREVRAEKRDTDRQVQAIKDGSDMLAEGMPEDASMHSVKFAMFTAKLKSDEALRNWGRSHPVAVAAKREESLLREYYQKATIETDEPPKSPKEDLIAEPLATLARLQHEELALESMIGEIDDRLAVLGGENSAKLEILRNEVARMERLSDRLWQTRENLEVERYADQRVQLVSLATLPNKRDTSKRSKLAIVLAAGGFGFAVLAVALAEFLTGRLHSQGETESRTGLQLVGSHRLLPSAVRMSEQVPAAGAEMDMLIAEVLNHRLSRHAHLILVTSAQSRSERGFLATHMAATLARAGKRTLLMELDFREPLPAPVCEPDSQGLASFLTSPCAESIPSPVPTETERLFRIPMGQAGEDPLSMLTDESLDDLVNAYRADFSHLVIDVASSRFPDALHVGRLADSVVLAVQRNVTRAGPLLEARRRLETLDVPVFGLLAC